MKNQRVLDYFKEISQFPRCSGHEEAISQYLVDTAEKLNLRAIRDDYNNVIIKKAASPGREGEEGVILQGHMDMVCVKDEGVDHDFSKDPIDLVIEDDILSAQGTSLGADNGIAVAIGLALLEDEDLSHPPLELVVTTDEEEGMTGAINFRDDVLEGKKMINIDTEEEGVLIAGCAGGINVLSSLNYPKTPAEGYTYELEISGLPGGHSGMEINQKIPNANKVLAEILKTISMDRPFRLISIEGGEKHNAIPSRAKATLLFEKPTLVEESEFFMFQGFRMRGIEGVTFRFEEVEVEKQAFDPFDSFSIIDAIDLLTDGVIFYTDESEEKVLTSANVAIVETKGEEVNILTSLRSGVEKHIEQMVGVFRKLIENKKGKVTTDAYYGPWEYQENSPLRDKMLAVYQEEYGKELTVDIIHAGLECAAFQEKYPGLDAVSIGPDMWDVHTPKERVSLSSVDRVTDYLKKVLENL